MQRHTTRTVNVGGVAIGGDAPISVQSMTTTDTADVEATVAQCNQLFDAGADIVRLAVLNHQKSEFLTEIRKRISKPLVADIHFQYKLALKAIAEGLRDGGIKI